jgi:DNA-binding transcriptional LysR family regulator
MIAPGHASGKSIVLMLTITYFLPMDLQVTHLRTLQAIARHGSFSRAAQALNLTQPAVSMQVRHLERALGLSLLERMGKRAFPTRAGEVLLAHADRALRELEAGVERVQELRGVVAGRVRLGTSASISIYLLPPALRRFRARYPETEIVIVTGNASEITRAIVANELDVGIVSLPVRDRELAVTPFFRDELVAIASPFEWGPRQGSPHPPNVRHAPAEPWRASLTGALLGAALFGQALLGRRRAWTRRRWRGIR